MPQDTAARSALGLALQAELTGSPPRDASSPMEQSWRDFVYAEVWSRPGLDRRARFLISFAGAAVIGHVHAMEAYARGALTTGELSLAELREAALHVAVYCGWSAGSQLDGAVSRQAADLGLPPATCAPIIGTHASAQARMESGATGFHEVMTFDGPQPGGDSPFLQHGILNFVFAEMWCRPGLDQRSRRWLTLVGVCESCADTPIKSHIHAAMASGNCSADELHEFVLQYAIHAGWPKASRIQGEVYAMAAKFAKGLAWNG